MCYQAKAVWSKWCKIEIIERLRYSGISQYPTLNNQKSPVTSDKTMILCVDDEPSALQLRTFLLQSVGYSVLSAGSGDEALRLLAERPDVQLVLLDYIMPGMNGEDLAGELRRQRPELPLIVVSGVDQLPDSLVKMVDGQVKKGEETQVLLPTVAAVLGKPEGQPLVSAPASQKTILCVEDEHLQLQLRKMLFESAGFLVLLARSGNEAMKLFHSHHVDAVVLDYWLSGKNGTALAEEMKRSSPRIPIVMLSGFSSLPGEDAVVDAWLRKATTAPEDLLNEVSRLVRLRSETETAPS